MLAIQLNKLEKVVDNILNARAWEVFVTLTLLSFAEWMIEDIYPVIGTIVDLISTVALYSWILLLGYGLWRMQTTHQSIGFWVFLGTGIQFTAAVCVAKLMKTELTTTFETNTFLAVLSIFHTLASVGIIFTFPARALKSLEMKADVDIKDYLGDTFRLIFWPIGIWSLQPRINRVVQSLHE